MNAAQGVRKELVSEIARVESLRMVRGAVQAQLLGKRIETEKGTTIDFLIFEDIDVSLFEPISLLVFRQKSSSYCWTLR